MEFIEWLDAHVLPERKSLRYNVVNQTVELWEKDENVDMSILIKGLLDPFVIIDPYKAGQWRLFSGLDGWGKNCDFLILGREMKRCLFSLQNLSRHSPMTKEKYSCAGLDPCCITFSRSSM